jgi:hypothetical protein
MKSAIVAILSSAEGDQKGKKLQLHSHRAVILPLLSLAPARSLPR